MKVKHLVTLPPMVVSEPEAQPNDIPSDQQLGNDGDAGDLHVDDVDDSEEHDDVPLTISEDTYLQLRDNYGDFLGRLESVHHVSQQAVHEIATEVLKLSSRVLSHCMNQVAENLGRAKIFIIMNA